MTYDTEASEPTGDPSSRAERTVAASARQRQRREVPCPRCARAAPLPVLITFVWSCTRSLQYQCRQFSHLPHYGAGLCP